MKIGLVGQTYQERSLPFDAQRMVNLYPVIDEQGKETAALYGTPGLDLFATAGSGAVRGCFAATNGRGFAVSGANLYEVLSNGTTSSLGTLDQSSGLVSMAENGFQLAICDGVSVYIFTYATNVFTKVSDVDLPPAGNICFIDGYFIINKNDTGSFYISALYDGTSWNSLDFATAESSPDKLIRVFNAVGQLWLMGSQTTEIWTNTGDSAFPFERIAGAKMEVGCLAPHSVVQFDNSIFWLGTDVDGSGIVYRAQGFTPSRISTSPIERLIQDATNQAEIRSYTYQEDGHAFFVLTGGGLKTSLVYDVTTKVWHERAYLNEFGDYEQHLANSHMFIFGKHLVGDRRNGKIYEMSLDYFSDNGDYITRERIYTHLSDENQRMRYNKLEIGFETGVGLQSGQGSNPLVSLQLSKDGARTWSDEYTTSIGAVGNYRAKAVFRRLGISEIMTFKIKISDPVKVAITGSYLF